MKGAIKKGRERARHGTGREMGIDGGSDNSKHSLEVDGKGREEGRKRGRKVGRK